MKNKVVVITGASQGLGHELAIQIAALGTTVALVSRTEKLLRDLKNQIIKTGGKAEYFICDVTKFDEVNFTVAKILAKFTTIDVLINNAGLYTTDKIESDNPQRTIDVFMVNSIAPIYLTKKVIPIFVAQNSGHFIFINSIAGLQMAENKSWSTYSASKWALTGYAKAIAAKFSGTPIKVTSIHPGPIDSKMPDNAGDDWGDDHSSMMSTAEVADVVVYALKAPNKIQVDTLEFKKTNWNLWK